MINRLFYIIMLLFFISCSINEDSLANNNSNLDVDTYYYIVDNNMEINFDINIEYKDLVFEKLADSFSSQIIFHIKILDVEGNIVYSDAWTQIVTADYYEVTKSDEMVHFHDKLMLPISNYDLYLSIDDYDNHKAWNVINKISYEKNDLISDIEFLYSNNNQFSRINENQLLEEIDSIWIKCQIKDDHLSDDSIHFQLKYPDYIKSENGSSEKSIISFIPKELHEIYAVPFSTYDIDSRYIIANVYYKDQIKSKELKLFKNMQEEVDFYQLIGPMEYILNIQDYIDYSELDTLQKIEFSEKYWKEKYNQELLNEFYNRVDYANNSFSLFLEKGWNSDRGKIYITYGEPLNISYDFNESGEFEIWTYKNRKFVFVNRFGIFELYNEFN